MFEKLKIDTFFPFSDQRAEKVWFSSLEQKFWNHAKLLLLPLMEDHKKLKRKTEKNRIFLRTETEPRTEFLTSREQWTNQIKERLLKKNEN